MPSRTDGGPEPAGNPSRVHVLIVDDEPSLRDSCASVLSHAGYEVTICGRAAEARNLLHRRGFDIVLLDLLLPQVTGLELLRSCLETKPDALVILMTARPDIRSCLEGLQAGAWDYLPKPFTATHLQILVGRAAHAVASRRAAEPHCGERGGSRPPGRGMPLLGRSPVFQRTVRLAEQVARTDASVFLTGESGTGKEVIAQFIHQSSRRSRRPLVAVNCAALPEMLLESELFGHVKGAFTGAVRDKPGLLETADGGTFFLDELTEMSQPLQAKLLRVIQDGVVRRVGSEREAARVDVRFIAATNRDPRDAVAHGVLRKDLYYRLSVFPIRIPPLRDRPEDVPLLANHFLATYWEKHRRDESPVPTFSDAALRSLQARPWIGNVRELQNAVEHAVVLLDRGVEVQPDDIPYLDGPAPPAAHGDGWAGLLPVDGDVPYHVARERVLAEFERHYLSRLVDGAGANLSRAAQLAGVDRTTLYRLLEKHGLQRATVVRWPRTGRSGDVVSARDAGQVGRSSSAPVASR